MNDAVDRLRLARAEGVGPVAYRRLMARYGNAAAALQALPGLARAGGRAAPLAIPDRDSAEREIAALDRLGGRLLFVDTQDYPPFLGFITDPPPALAALGDIACLARRPVAIVGSRNASANGQRIAEGLAEELAASGCVVVSGLARGIDAAAHLGALRAGPTIACVAGGLDVIYPPQHAALQARIAENGLVLAEARLGTEPLARHFPRRNRIIAGLSLGVVIVEAAPKSGSLITARLAREADRELFAVPGSPLDARCRGSNALLRDGAHLTETAADVLANLPDHPLRVGLERDPLFVHGPAPKGLAEPLAAMLGQHAPDEWEVAGVRGRLLALLSPDPTSVDDLIRRCQFSAAATAAALLELELAGRVESLPGHRVALIGTARDLTMSPTSHRTT
jgi:DNA processing protein